MSTEAALTSSKPLLSTKDWNLFLHLLTDFGRALFGCGAEIYRVEESMSMIAQAYAGNQIEVFAVLTLITVSITDDKGVTYNKSVRLKGREADLDKLERLNKLSRQVCNQPLSLAEFQAQLQAIVERPAQTYLIKMLGGTGVSMGFAYMLGCPLLTTLWAIPITICMFLAKRPLQRLGVNRVFVNLLCSFIISGLSVLIEYGFALTAVNSGLIIIGCMMNLVPGLTLTNGIRDLIASDYIAGISNLTEAVLMATGMAIGSGIALALGSYL